MNHPRLHSPNPHLIAAMVTPFTREGDIDRASLHRLVHYLRQNGVDEYFVLGSTGESPLLDDLRSLSGNLVDDDCVMTRQLRALLSRQELAAMRRRVDQLLRSSIYPAPIAQRRNYPWPPI